MIVVFYIASIAATNMKIGQIYKRKKDYDWYRKISSLWYVENILYVSYDEKYNKNDPWEKGWITSEDAMKRWGKLEDNYE